MLSQFVDPACDVVVSPWLLTSDVGQAGKAGAQAAGLIKKAMLLSSICHPNAVWVCTLGLALTALCSGWPNSGAKPHYGAPSRE